MKIICTICSKSKLPDVGLLPAKDRYIGLHIKETIEFSEKENLPLYILSGKYGLISGDENISNYDYYLKEEDIPALAVQLQKQFLALNITEINFCIKQKPDWAPYIRVLTESTRYAGIPIHLQVL